MIQPTLFAVVGNDFSIPSLILEVTLYKRWDGRSLAIPARFALLIIRDSGSIFHDARPVVLFTHSGCRANFAVVSLIQSMAFS